MDSLCINVMCYSEYGDSDELKSAQDWVLFEVVASYAATFFDERD